jgi:multiple sugar transport system permease protein
VTITILASANMFGQAVLVTQGAPGDTTRTAIMVIADTGFTQFRMGQATAMSYLLALALMLVSLINFVLLRERRR